ncbi:MAG: glycosyltransferase, partial [Candidatus Bathyarchaeia archaeon]
YYDNFPLVTLMGLAYKIPVIGSDIGGIPEVVQDGKNGFLFKPGRSDVLASVIERIAANPQILQSLRENIVSPRRVEEEALDYENIYTKMTTQAFPPPESKDRKKARLG